MAPERNNPCYILRAGYWGVAKLVPARSAGLGKLNRHSCCKDALRELQQGPLVDEDFGEAMGIDFFNGRGVGFGFGIGCGFGIGWGFGGTPLQTLGLGAGGGCGVGLGLGWGFGSAYGTRYLDSKLKFQGTDFGKVKTAAASQQPLNSPQKDS